MIDNIIRDIVRDEIAALGNPRAADPVLLTVEEVSKKHEHLNKSLLYELCDQAATNGFPVVRLSTKKILIDNARLNKWIADGGLGVKV